MENNDPVMEYGERFKRRPSLSELVATHEQRKRSLREEARRIKDSSEARKFLIKNIGKKDPYELLAVACRCIYDLTGDTYFEKHTRETISQIKEGTI